MDDRNNHRLGDLVPLVLFVLLFVVCCGVMACVFLRAASVNESAGAYDAGVQLCRNQAELCRAAGIPEGTAVYYYDEDFREVADGGAYYVTVTGKTEKTAAGQLQEGTVTAFTSEDRLLYTVDVAVYLPDGR